MTRVEPIKKPPRPAPPKSAVKPANVQAVTNYFSRLPEPARTTLQSVRAAILSACPKSTIETLSSGIPPFKHNGINPANTSFKDPFRPFPKSYFVIDKFRPQPSRFEVSKGTVRF